MVGTVEVPRKYDKINEIGVSWGLLRVKHTPKMAEGKAGHRHGLEMHSIALGMPKGEMKQRLEPARFVHAVGPAVSSAVFLTHSHPACVPPC